ncbi:MAG: thrombospondin type 3 repeat-containing protein [Anaerolineae bacterium]
MAINAQGTSSMVTLTVNVLGAADRDADGFPDAQDACPEQPAPANGGCPISNDADNDGLPDDQDACPQEAGQPEDGGCPAENRPDQDGDGVLDRDDHCPSQPGRPEWNGCPQEGWLLDSDGDTLVDTMDSCPNQPGPQDNNGCPLPQQDDRDGDGVPDGQEVCPDQPGAPQNGGCPLADDRDRDGVPDAQDQCPNLAGWRQFGGCLPPGWLLDSDHDGILDGFDRCPDQRGSFPWGCPAPSDRDGDGVSDNQDRCPDRSGEAWNHGCPDERLLPRPEETPLCVRFPIFPCPQFGDIDCNANPQACGLAGGCYNDADCDGVWDSADECPDHFGLGLGVILDGCPLDWNGNNQADEQDNDGDGVPNEMDSCPQAIGSIENSGCPRPEAETVNLAIELRGFSTPNTAFENFYCYVRLQDSAWVRLPQSGSLPRSGQAYPVGEEVEINIASNQPVQLIIRCEGQANSIAPVQDLGRLVRSHGPQFWHCNWMDFWSDTGGFVAEYRICEE